MANHTSSALLILGHILLGTLSSATRCSLAAVSIVSIFHVCSQFVCLIVCAILFGASDKLKSVCLKYFLCLFHDGGAAMSAVAAASVLIETSPRLGTKNEKDGNKSNRRNAVEVLYCIVCVVAGQCSLQI